MKKLLTLLVLFAMLFTSCNTVLNPFYSLEMVPFRQLEQRVAQQQPIEQPETEITHQHIGIEKKDYYGYSRLSDTEKQIYDRIDKAARQYWTIVDLKDLQQERSVIDKVYEYFVSDNPGVFWLYNYEYYWAGPKSDKIGYLFLLYMDDTTVDEMDDNFVLTQTANRDRITVLRIEFEEKANSVLENLSTEAESFEKEVKAYQYLSRFVKYDDGLAKSIEENNVEIPIQQSAYGALCMKSTVCSGYAKAFQYLMLEFGVECLSVYGKVEETEYHQWNIIKLDGNYFHVDPTWGKVLLIRSEQFVNYDYLNLSDKQIGKTHTPEPFKNPETGQQLSYDYPACTTENSSFNKPFEVTVTKEDKSLARLRPMIENIIRYKVDVLHLRFSEEFEEYPIQSWYNKNGRELAILVENNTDGDRTIGDSFYYAQEDFRKTYLPIKGKVPSPFNR